MIRVTAGDHPYFGRVVLNAPGLSYAVNRDGAHVVILFSGDPMLGDLPPTPRNVLALRAVPGGIELTVPLGASVRSMRYGDKVVVDIDDTVANRPPLNPLTDVQPAPRREPGSASARPGENSQNVAPDGVSGQRSEPPPMPAETRAREKAPHSGEPAGNGVAGSVALDRTPTSGTATGSVGPGNAALANAVLARAAAGTSVSATAVQGNAAPSLAAPRGPALPQVVAPAGRLRGILAEPPPARPQDAAAQNTRALLMPGSPGAVASTPNSAAAIPVQAGPDNVSSVTFGPIAQDVAPMPQTGNSVASGALTRAPETSPTEAVAQPTTPPPREPDATPPAVAPDTVKSSPEGVVAVQQGPVQVWPVTQDTLPLGPVALRAVRSRPPDGLAGVAVGLPFRGTVGAALLSRGPDIFVVFDERRPIDLSALQDDPVFGPAVVTLYPAATVIRLASRPGQAAMLFPDPMGWRLSVVPTTPKPAAFAETVIDGGITFAGSAPGQVVAITDPGTGGTLLVGTQRTSGQGVLVERRTPEFDLPVTGQGIVVEPLSDAISLRITQAGFVLSGGPVALALSPPQPMPEATIAAAALTRRFEFPRQTTETLVQRAKQQRVAAARAPLLKRGPLRHALAESMLGLGRGVEAQTLLQVTMKDDPNEADSAAAIGLAAIAALRG